MALNYSYAGNESVLQKDQLYFSYHNRLRLDFKYTEQEIVSNLKQNDQVCFSDLYDHYSGALYGIIYKMIPDKMVSEKALQQTFIEVRNSIENYDSSKEMFFTWMVTIAKHCAVDIIQRENYRKSFKTRRTKKSENNGFDADSLVTGKQARSLNNQKQILDLAYFGNHTVDHISKRLSISPETVRAKLQMAIKEIRCFK